jgi:hypothetical protein
MPLRTLAKRCMRLSPLLAAPAALLLIQGEAKAILTYNIFESAGNVVVQTSGSLDLTGSQYDGSTNCGVDGGISSYTSSICTGTDPGSPINALSISGPIFLMDPSTYFQRPASLEYILAYLVYLIN